MKLHLDHIQRLNLHALMGAQRATVDDMRLWWRLQDMIDLNDDERKQINYRTEKIPGTQVEQPVWDLNKKLASKAFEFPESEYQKIEKIVREWAQGFIVGNDRRWLEPMLDQFDAAKKVNGNAATETAVPARHRA